MSRALVLLLVLAAPAARAVYQCGDTQDTCPCGAPNPYPCCENGGNCTWYAWHGACCAWGVGLPGWGNAKQWTGNANANASYDVQARPVTGAVSCRDLGTYGHVAFTTALTGPTTVQVREQSCWGNYGTSTTNYQVSYWTGGFITRAGAVECNPGDGQSRSCGNCGSQSRGCGNDGRWGGWSACGGEGVCTPGAEETRACGDCGVARRTCSASCQWNGFAACASAPDADLDAGTCDTGRFGACGTGTRRCAAGTFTCDAPAPVAEVCDGVDNDCDGLTDGPQVCVVTVGAPPSPTPETPADSTPTHRTLETVRGGCGVALGWPLLGLAALLLRRRR